MSEVLKNEDKTVEKKKSARKGLLGDLALCALGVAVIASPAIGVVLASADKDHKKNVEIPQIEAEMAEDGFVLATDRWDQKDVDTIYFRDGGVNTVTVSVDLGGCKIPVDTRFEHDEEKNITDVHTYSFDGYVMAKVVKDSDRQGKITTYHERYAGEPITFTFDNLDGLQETLQTEEVCAVLAQSYVPNTTIPR